MSANTQSIRMLLQNAFSSKTFLGILYLFLSLPLGIIYFVFLMVGLSLGFGLLIIWIGIPILLFMIIAWWGLLELERNLTNALLDAQIPPFPFDDTKGLRLIEKFKVFIKHPITWKGLFYLFAMLPLGVLGFTIMVTLLSLSLALLLAPLAYPFNIINSDPGFNLIDSWWSAWLAFLIGIPVTIASLNLLYYLAEVMRDFARVMLGEKNAELT